MTTTGERYAVPEQLGPDLGAVLEHWRRLRRGENRMPFADDLNLSALPAAGERAMLLDVFEDPLRYRINHLGPDLSREGGGNLSGRFLDEVAGAPALDGLGAQAAATVTTRAPTYGRGPNGSGRLLMPTWGDGRVSLILGVVERT